MSQNQMRGVHFNGSINLSSTSAVFNNVPRLLPQRLRRIPDGETGKRDYFISWQLENFSAAPEIVIVMDFENQKFDFGPPSLSSSEVATSLAKLGEINARYHEHALESYDIFRQKKAEGIIPKDVRFQVCIPGLVNVMSLITTPFKRAIEPLYEKALLHSLQVIQDSIPHSELAVQVDVAIEIAALENVPFWPIYIPEPLLEGIITRLARFSNHVAEGVELGFHLCYGDLFHRHFIEPRDLGLLVQVSNELRRNITRPIQWIHMPVPKDRKDAKYFEPLKGLEWKVPELYLGLVHPFDEEGTAERIEAAKVVVEEFGVATECGMGRMGKEEFATVMEILRAISGSAV
ncbi:hypothetical protein B0J11DRAFT_67131 [Dendryphion nanum]|uniref:Uncharacterized protein n=1 Tax=Dendryphion nanum TaxID=256645 RepID=A0A9P9IGE7_9PLEO|nr:hypothetical protein B0J11DRAFT_67131 [Dendryphion nanum]